MDFLCFVRHESVKWYIRELLSSMVEILTFVKKFIYNTPESIETEQKIYIQKWIIYLLKQLLVR